MTWAQVRGELLPGQWVYYARCGGPEHLVWVRAVYHKGDAAPFDPAITFKDDRVQVVFPDGSSVFARPEEVRRYVTGTA